MKLVVRLTLCEVLLRVECRKAFFHAGIINAQELVLCGCHVDKIRLALRAFLIEELVHRLIRRGLFQVSTDDLVQRFPQMRRAAFGRRDALGTVLAGLVHSWIDASETDDGAAAREAAYIADLRQKLLCRCGNKQFGVVVLRQRGEMAAAFGVNIQRLFCAEMITFAFAP